MIAELVAKLIAVGTPAEVAAEVIAEAFAAGVTSVGHVTYADESVTRRRENDRIRKQRSRDNLRMSRDVTGQSQDASISKIKKDSKRQNSHTSRGTRMSPDWKLSDVERLFARQEGFTDFEIDREASRFRDYWLACAGAKGIKLDWSATWRQWTMRGAERAGKAPQLAVPSAQDPNAIDWDQVLSSYKKFGHWSKWAGPGLDSPACRAPPEMLAKYDLRVTA